MSTLKSYTQDILSQQDIRIGSVRLFVAPLPTAGGPTYAETKFITATPPTGWVDLGAMGEDTVVEATREVFSLKLGVLKVTKFQAVIGLEGRVSGNLHEFSGANIEEVIGGPAGLVVTGGKKYAVGTSVIRRRQVLAVHDTIAGDASNPQIVYHFPEASALSSPFRPNIGNDRENIRLPIQFDAYGVPDTAFADTIVFLVYDFD